MSSPAFLRNSVKHLGEWDVQAAYNYYSARYGQNAVDLVIADPVAAISAGGANVLGEINGLFRIPAPSDSNVMYRSPPAAFATFH
jgi:hypothetical protein